MLLRLLIALAFPNIIAFDEVFQNLEPAHRLVFGQGVVAWEFQIGMRNWLIPLLLAGVMEVGRAVSSNPLAGLVLVRVALVVGSLPVVWCAMRWGEACFGARGGWVAGGLAACWPDFAVMAPHTLQEVFAADALVPGVYLAGRRNLAAGVFLGLALVFRVQVAPAVLVAVFWSAGRDVGRWRGLLGGMVWPVLFAGGLDWASWGAPFRSFWLDVWVNEALGVADFFGRQPVGYYVAYLAYDWLWTLPVMLVLMWLGAKRLPMPAVAAAALFLAHMALGHKEFRFVFPAEALAVPVAGVGLAWVLDKGRWRWVVAAAALVGPVCSPLLYDQLRFGVGSFAVFEALARARPAVVAVGRWQDSFVPLDILWPGDMRLTSLSGLREAGFMVAQQGTVAPPAGDHVQKCFPGMFSPFAGSGGAAFCVWRNGAPLQGAAPALDLGAPAGVDRYLVRDRFDGG